MFHHGFPCLWFRCEGQALGVYAKEYAPQTRWHSSIISYNNMDYLCKLYMDMVGRHENTLGNVDNSLRPGTASVISSTPEAIGPECLLRHYIILKS